MNRFINKVRSNKFKAVFISLIIAIFLWFYVKLGIIYEYQMDIPIVPINIRPNKVLKNEIPKYATVRLEGMGSSILDAMACRLPVVATKVGGIPEVVKHRETGLLVPPRSPSALAKAILKLYDNRELALSLGQKGYQVVHQKFSAEAMADKIILLYEDIGLKKWIKLHEKA